MLKGGKDRELKLPHLIWLYIWVLFPTTLSKPGLHTNSGHLTDVNRRPAPFGMGDRLSATTSL